MAQSNDRSLVTGPYIAFQSVGTQFIGGRHTHQYHNPEQPQHADERIVEDVEYKEQSPEAKPEAESDFPYLTKKCFDENRVATVEAEIQAARKGTAEDMWRTLWTNENLGYLEVKFIDATTLYRAIEKWYGKLPYTDRNFRGARSKR